MGVTNHTPLQDDRFLLLQALGRGGMGAVYRAFDRAEQRLVALKVPTEDDRPGPAHPLSAEFDQWSRLSHPNIVRAYEMVHAGRGPLPRGRPYLVLEHVCGRPVTHGLSGGSIDGALAEALAAQLLSALDHVHQAGLLHRDLKPGNVLALPAEDGLRLKLTDFGLAAPIGRAGEAGTFSGSLPYVAPEALLGLPLDGRADLYALGVLLYRLTTGRMPVSSGSPNEILRWHLTGPPADPARANPAVSPRMCRFVRRLTRRDRGRRPTSARLALQMLGAADPAPTPRTDDSPAWKGARARLRLALDAVRLGARRLFRMPAEPGVAAALSRELAVWAQVRGLRFYRLAHDVDRAILRMLADQGTQATELVRRFELDRHLAIDVVGGVPLPAEAPNRAGPAADGAARVLVDCMVACTSRPTVVCLDPAPDASALAAAVRERLVAAVDGPTLGAAVPPAGLLLAIAP